MRKKAFTLAEVLITLGVIGVVAAMTIPTLIQNTQNAEYKTAYKKAYSDLSQIFIQNLQECNWPSRLASTDAGTTAQEWNIIKSGFKVVKECSLSELNQCWGPGEMLFEFGPPVGGAYSFIDSSGRSWAELDYQENLYLVDTNGFKPPNKFGKDRWIFTFWDLNNTRVSVGFPSKLGIYYNDDLPSKNINVCNYPPCYYKSWLYNN